MKKCLLLILLIFSINLQATNYNDCFDELYSTWDYVEDMEMELKIGSERTQNYSMNLLVRSCYKSLQVCNKKDGMEYIENWIISKPKDTKWIGAKLKKIKIMCDNLVEEAKK